MTLRTTLCATLLSLAASSVGVAAQDRHVTIHNDTGYTLYHFYSTNSGSTKWGKDILGSSMMPNGSAVRMNFDNKYGYCEFDFKAVFEDGSEMQRANINVCEIGDYYYQP